MKEYIKTKEEFYKIKSQLDGHIFWREDGDNIIIRLIVPLKEFKKLLET